MPILLIPLAHECSMRPEATRNVYLKIAFKSRSGAACRQASRSHPRADGDKATIKRGMRCQVVDVQWHTDIFD